jgi:hypothetical protein
MNNQLLTYLVENKLVEFDKSSREYVFTSTRTIGMVITDDVMVVLESIYVDEEDSFIGVDFKGKKYDLAEVDFDLYTSGVFDKKDRIL